MTLARRPIRSPRALYKIDLVNVHLDDLPAELDPAPTQTVGGGKRSIVVKIKEAVGDWLGLVPIAWNDPLFTGVFPTDAAATNPAQENATNQGSTYRKNIGGFREATYTLIARTKFTISEIVKTDDGYTRANADFISVGIGFPKGHSVTEVINWLATTPRFSSVRAIRTPSGRRVFLTSVD